MTIILNKSNWTGESVTVQVNQFTKQFTFGGDRYRLRVINEAAHAVEQLEYTGWRLVATLYGPDKGRYTAISAFCDLSRDANCPFKAAVKLLCNT
jgi:hypothetical protein